MHRPWMNLSVFLVCGLLAVSAQEPAFETRVRSSWPVPTPGCISHGHERPRAIHRGQSLPIRTDSQLTALTDSLK